jgi:hypothetical protein
MCIPGSLSLSPPLEKRARGGVGGSQTLVRSNHPSLPYQADVHLHTSLRPTPPFIPYWADVYLIDVINKVHICPIWCNAASSSVSYWACWGLQATIKMVHVGMIGCNATWPLPLHAPY